jgi:hypothetical protein
LLLQAGAKVTLPPPLKANHAHKKASHSEKAREYDGGWTRE